MEKILKNQEEAIAFQWRGNTENADITLILKKL